MSDNQNEVAKNATKAEQEKLLAIRDIIFGNEIQEYNKEFETLKDLIDKNKATADESNEELIQRISTLENELRDFMSDIEKKLEAQISDLKEAKADRQLLGSLLEELGRKLQA